MVHVVQAVALGNVGTSKRKPQQLPSLSMSILCIIMHMIHKYKSDNQFRKTTAL